MTRRHDDTKGRKRRQVVGLSLDVEQRRAQLAHVTADDVRRQPSHILRFTKGTGQRDRIHGVTRQQRGQLLFWLCVFVLGIVIWVVSGRLAN